MYVLIVGGGNTGSYLARLLIDAGHKVRVIEQRPVPLEKLRTEIPPESLIIGDGSSPLTLEQADVSSAHVLAAVTGSDDTNLVVTSLARFEFNVPRVIARINNPKNAWLFTGEMGVDVALNQADVLAHLIEEEMSVGDMMTLFKIRRGQYSVVEEKVAPGAKAIGVALKDMGLEQQCVIAAIIRDGKMVLPRADSTFQEGDEILAVASAEGARKLSELLAHAVYPVREHPPKPPDP
ncbi:MAG TPA: TrkA family potassium uptake protein [Anaerolineales bacterium]